MAYTDTRYFYLEYWHFNKGFNDRETCKLLKKQKKRGINHIKQLKQL